MAVEAAEQQQTAALEAENHAGVDAGDDSSDDGESEGCSESDTDGSEGSESQEGGGENKKAAAKKKKKKKKKKAGGGGDGHAPPPVDAAARKEGDRRFQEAVDQLSHNSEDSMWVKLSGCHLADVKMKKLCEALKSNSTIISLDLSANNLTDEGAKALAVALQDGRAPDLIELDLQDNPIKEGGASALEELQHHRKTLRVSVGPSQPPPQQQQEAAAGDAHSGKGEQQQQQQNGGGTLADTVKSNPVISKYFQVGNDEESDEQQQQHGGQQQEQQRQEEQQQMGGLSESELARILWDQLEQCLDAAKPNIPAVSEPLRAIAEQVEHEMDNCVLPMLANTELHELKTFTKWALGKLHIMHSVLDLVPPPMKTSYSKQTPVPAVGSHRAAVAELLAQLLRAECPVVAQLVAASGVLRRCAAIAVAHPNCSAIHGAVGRCLKLSLSKAVGHVGLWKQLLGSAPAGSLGATASRDLGGSLNLAAEAAAIAVKAHRSPSIGKRDANVGFALAVGQLLHAAATGEVLGANSEQEAQPAGTGTAPSSSSSGGGGSGGAAGQKQQAKEQQQPQQQPQQAGELSGAASADFSVAAAGAACTPLGREDDSWERQLQQQLAAADPWVEFSSGEGCLLRKLLGEHVGDLGAPRPRPGAEPEAGSDDNEVSSGQIISGQELLMMLRGLNLGGFSGGM